MIWAMGDAAVRAGLAAGAADLAFPAVQRLLCLGEGGLVQDAIATPAAWDVAVKTVASRQVDRPEGLQSPGQWDQDWD
ncbi:MAG: hypothetical protein HC824_13125 [Synechococcales cyanobacterium RM1_1_8]|nr:hypothetical protein [Synechococcales cyanobacterium RM1_1_8]